MKVCAVIPAYNEGATIGEVVRETRKYVDAVLVVDDGSTDSTAGEARSNGAQVIQHSQNKGIGLALQSGYDVALQQGFDYVVQLDSDGQHDPRHIPEMLEVAQSCDMVIASRFLNKSIRSYPFIRRLGISFFTRVVNLLTRAGITDVNSGYRVLRGERLKRLRRIESHHWAVAQTLEAAKRGYGIKEVSIEMPLRKKGRSQFSFLVYGLYPLRMIGVILKVMLLRGGR